MILLFDIGNTNTHMGLADGRGIRRHVDIPTSHWKTNEGSRALTKLVGTSGLKGAAICSVVPRLTPKIQSLLRGRWQLSALVLGPQTLRGVGIDYPHPNSIGPDRLANAVAARIHFGAPVVVVDFGTAVTFDVVNGRGDYVGGIIAPGLAAMTDYLHERTALLPRIEIRDVKSAIGRSTEQAMRIGAVHGYRGLVRELIKELKQDLGTRSLKVVATGGYARLIGRKLKEISVIEPNLTLEGLRLVWMGGDENRRGVGRATRGRVGYEGWKRT